MVGGYAFGMNVVWIDSCLFSYIIFQSFYVHSWTGNPYWSTLCLISYILIFYMVDGSIESLIFSNSYAFLDWDLISILE